MLLGILDRLLESSPLTEGDIEELDPVFFAVEVPHLEEFFEVFFGTGIE
jgi:hypothetical protein